MANLPLLRNSLYETVDEDGIAADRRFWECNCFGPEYQHLRAEEGVCPACGLHADECPDSFVNELLTHGYLREGSNG